MFYWSLVFIHNYLNSTELREGKSVLKSGRFYIEIFNSFIFIGSRFNTSGSILSVYRKLLKWVLIPYAGKQTTLVGFVSRKSITILALKPLLKWFYPFNTESYLRRHYTPVLMCLGNKVFSGLTNCYSHHKVHSGPLCFGRYNFQVIISLN